MSEVPRLREETRQDALGRRPPPVSGRVSSLFAGRLFWTSVRKRVGGDALECANGVEPRHGAHLTRDDGAELRRHAALLRVPPAPIDQLSGPLFVGRASGKDDGALENGVERLIHVLAVEHRGGEQTNVRGAHERTCTARYIATHTTAPVVSSRSSATGLEALVRHS